MSKQREPLQDPLEGQVEFDPNRREAEEATVLEYQEPVIEEPEEAGEDEDEDPAPIVFQEDDWRFEVQSEAKRALEALNPGFYQARRRALEAASDEIDAIMPEVTTLFYSAENLLRLMRMTNKGASWKCKEEMTINKDGIREKVNNHERWQILGHAAPQGPNVVPVMAFRTEGMKGESWVEFRVA